MFLVVVIHNGDMFLQFDREALPQWFYSNAIASFARISVPLFFMISGYLLLKPNINVKSFYSKRLSRILIPWLFWSIFYILFRILCENTQISFLSSIRLIWTNGVFYHLWFMYAIFGVYISIPFLSRLLSTNKDESSNNIAIIFLLIWFLIYSIIPFVTHFLQLGLELNFTSNFHLDFFTGFIGLALVGHVIGKVKNSKVNKRIAFVIFVLSYFITFSGNYLYNLNNDYLIEYFNGYSRPNIILMSVSCFYIFKNYKFKKTYKFITVVGNLSFGIYLVHPFIISVLKNYSITKDFFISDFILLRSLLIFLVSFCFVFLFSKIPLAKKLV